MSEDILIVERDASDSFMTVTLNRPDKMNALDVELSDRLE